MSASNHQEGGTHYLEMEVEPWTALESWLTPEQFGGYLLGTAIAYLARVNAEGEGKGGMADVRKAHHVLSRLIETDGRE